MEKNPRFFDVVVTAQIRNGLFRANSILNVPLSYGEFAAMIASSACISSSKAKITANVDRGCCRYRHGDQPFCRRGSRGGRVAFVVSISSFFVLWAMRTVRLRPRSMVGALLGTLAFIGTTALLGLVLAVKNFA